MSSQFWKNFPIPEGHLATLVVGLLLHRLYPLRLFRRKKKTGAGWLLVSTGFLAAAWATAEAGEMGIEKPDHLISGGPYAFSRNPMYTAWTMIYSGFCLVANSLWLAIFLPFILTYTHYFAVLPEERSLEERFGPEYQQYALRVHRYIPFPTITAFVYMFHGDRKTIHVDSPELSSSTGSESAHSDILQSPTPFIPDKDSL
jgi:protein-S-isoprenylcysteine O-methyltransferase Ste14